MESVAPVVKEILAATNAPERWEQALDCFADSMAIDAACLFSVHEFSSFSMNFVWSRYNRQKLSHDFMALMERGGDEDDRQGYNFIMSNPPQRFYDELEMFGCESADELPPSYVRDVARSAGLNMRHAAVLNHRGPWVDGLFCQTQQETRAHEFLSRDLAGVLLPVFSHSITLGRTLSALRIKFGAALDALNHLGIGVALVERGEVVLEANEEAERIFDLSDGVSLSRRGQLTFADPNSASEYQTLVQAAFAALDGDANSGSHLMACKRVSQEHDFLISVRPLADAADELENNLRCAFVTIIDPHRAGVLSSQGIALLGNLTATETEVVDLLLQGLRPAEISDERDVSLNTTKTHLKRISDKLRCRSQSDVIRVAAATSLPISRTSTPKK